MGVQQLAKEIKIHRTTVMAHLRRRGVQARRNVRKLDDAQVKTAAERYEQDGLSLDDLAEVFGVTSETIRRQFIKAEVERRAPGRRSRTQS